MFDYQLKSKTNPNLTFTADNLKIIKVVYKLYLYFVFPTIKLWYSHKLLYLFGCSLKNIFLFKKGRPQNGLPYISYAFCIQKGYKTTFVSIKTKCVQQKKYPFFCPFVVYVSLRGIHVPIIT